MTTIYPDYIILDFSRERFPSFPFIPPKSQLDAILELDPYEKKRVSVIYNMIMDLKPISWDKTKMHGKKICGSSFLKICGKVVWNVFILYHCVYTRSISPPTLLKK